MKKLILSLIAVMATISVNAQTVNVHLKDGQTIQYNSSEVDYVDFSEKSVVPTPTPTPSVANPVITFSVKIVNQSGSEFTLDGDVVFLLGNPDHNGTYLGWEGNHNETDPIRFSSSPVFLAAGETKTFDGLTWRDQDTGYGMGEKSPFDPSNWDPSRRQRKRNVKLLVNGKEDIVQCENLDPNIIFKEGGIYTIVISSVNNPTPVTPDPVTPDPTPVNPNAGTVTASFMGGAVISTNDRIQNGSQLNVKFSNNTNEGVTLTEMHLIDSQTGNAGNNLLNANVWVPAGESVAYTITVGVLGIYKPIIRFTYIRNDQVLTVEDQWSSWSPVF